VKVIQERRQGMIFARNRGFNSAKYKTIARTDADVILPKDWIKKIKQNFSANNIDALGGSLSVYDLPFNFKFFWRVFVFVVGGILKGNILIGPNMVITKNAWEKIKNKVCLNETGVHEDIDLTIHIQKNGGVISYDKTLMVGFSGRRIKNNPFSFFIEYQSRLIKTLYSHSK
ncbi:MAG: glycosyltransferase, partial [bacterium]|nr:glycosyltransferase [bacterium]